MKQIKTKSESIKRELQQFFVLLKHFSFRLFSNDIIKFENQKSESLIIFMTILAAAGGLISVILLMPYLYGMPGYTSETAWSEKTFFLTLSMAFTGIISVINWDNMSLDEKDYLNLSWLPIKPNTLYAAKFFSLLAFVGIISLAFNFFSIYIFTLFLRKIINVNPFYDTGIFKFGIVHLLVGFMANLFVFLVVASIQSLLISLFDAKGFKKMSLVVQTFLLIGFISIFVWFPKIASSIVTFKDEHSSFIYYFPPLWFAGFYEQMIGNYDFVFKRNYYIAGIAVLLLTDLYLINIGVSFKKFSRAASVSRTGKKITKTTAFLKESFNSLFLRNPIQKAIFYFSLSTLNRSRKHKFQSMLYIVLPLAFVITELVVLALTKGWVYFETVSFFLTAIPLVLYFFLIVGLRVVVMHPVIPEANWIFRLTAENRPKHYMRGLKKALFFVGILPLFILLFLFYYACWGFITAFYHSFFTFAAALLIMEISFINYSKMPFVSAYVPGKANIKAYWFLYVGAFITYVYASSILGIFLMENPVYYIAFYTVIFDLLFLIKLYRHRRNKDFSFVFDEEPEPAMLSLGFDL